MLDTSQTDIQLDISTAETRKVQRWRLRETAKKIARFKRRRTCGNVLGNAVAVQKLASGEGALGGLETCASVWCCPPCSAKITAHRQREVSQVMEKCIQENKWVSMLTLTQRHHQGQSLEYLWESLSKAWQYVCTGGKYYKWKDAIKFGGYIRAVEVTNGDNGWHCHTHIIIISDVNPLEQTISIRSGRMKGTYTAYQYVTSLWQEKLRKLGLDFYPEFGSDWSVAQPGDEKVLGAYINKVARLGLDKEVTLGSFKEGRRGSRTPFEILDDYHRLGLPQDLALWQEWESASYNKRQLLWSRGLRAWAGLDTELTDDEILQQNSERETLFFISRQDWKFLLQSGIGALLTGDNVHYVRLLDRFGIVRYSSVTDVPIHENKSKHNKYKKSRNKDDNKY